jgi:TP901 family phage tail tape measure protein
MSELGKLEIKIDANTDGLRDGVGEVARVLGAGEKSAQKFGEQLKKVGEQLQNAARPMMAFGAAVTGALGLSVKAFGDFDAAMNESLAIMGDVTDAQRNGMVEAAKDVARTTTFSSKEAAAAFYYLASAGLDAEQSIAALPAVAKFAQAGLMDLETATSYLLDSQAALGLTSEDAAQNMQNMVKVSDSLTEAANVTNASISEFAEALTNKAATAMRMANMDIDQGVAILMAFAQQGKKGAEAGEMLNMVLRDIDRGWRTNRQAWLDAGVAVYDASGQMRNMSDIVRELEQWLAPLSPEMKNVAMSTLGMQERSLIYTKTLLGTSSALATYEAKLRAAGGTTKEIADKQLQTLNNQLKIAKNNIEIAAQTIGGQLAPAITQAAQKISEAASAYAKWSDAHPGLSRAITGVLGVLGTSALVGGTLLFALGSAAKSIGAITTLFPKLKAGLFGTAAAVTVLAVETAKWLSLQIQLKKALDYESEANDRLVQTNIQLENKLYGLVKAGKMTVDQFYKLKDQFYQNGAGADDYAQKMWNWIKSGKAGTDAAKGLADMSAEGAKQFKAAGKSAKDAAGDVGDLGDSMGGAAKDAKTLKEELGLVFKSDLEQKIKDIEKALKDFREQLSPEQEKELRTALVDLKIATGDYKLGVTELTKTYRSSFEYYQQVVGAFTASFGTWEQIIAKTGLTRVQFDDLAKKFYALASASRLNVGKISDDAKKLEEAWEEAWLSLSRDFAKAFAGMAAGTKSFTEGMKSVFENFAEAVGQIIGDMVTTALDSLDKMAGPLGALFGGLVGGLLGGLASAILGTGDAAEQAAVEMSEFSKHVWDVYNAQKALLAETKGVIKSFQRLKAEMENALDTADKISEAFEFKLPTVEDITGWAKGLQRILGDIKSGAMDAAVGTKSLDDAFSSLLEQTEGLGFKGKMALADFIKQAREMGLEIPSVIAYVNDQLGLIEPESLSAADGLAAMAAAGGQTAESLQRVGDLTLATYSAMIANGASASDALASLGPTLDALAQQYADMGIDAPPAIAQLLKIREVTTANQDLFDAIAGNQAVFEALAATGFMTAESLADISAQAGDYYNQLMAAGLTSDEALATMAPTLQSLQDYANQYGITLDDNTLALIAQADALGLIAETPVDPGTAMADGFAAVTDALNEIVDVLTSAFPQAAQRAARSLGDNVGRAVDDINARMVDGARNVEDEWAKTADAIAISLDDEMGRSIDNINAKMVDGAKSAGNEWEKAADSAASSWGNLAVPFAGGSEVTGYASGGVAWTPQFATVAETQPEVIIPMSDYMAGTGLAAGVGAGTGAGAGGTIVNLTIHAQRLDDNTIRAASEKIYSAIEFEQRRRGKGL